MESTRKRAANFTGKEESLIVELVKKRKLIIECKRTDATSNSTKAAAWVELSDEFNAICGGPYRDVKAIKMKYENMKKSTKKKHANEKCFQRGTGGGPSKDFKFSQAEDDIKELLGQQVTGMVSVYDDDQTAIVEVEDNLSEADVSPTDCIVTADLSWAEYTAPIIINPKSTPLPHVAEANPAGTSWAKCNPVALKTPKSVPLSDKAQANPAGTSWAKCNPTALKTPKSAPLSDKARTSRGNERRNLSDKLSKWTLAKTELCELQKQSFLEQHKLKLEFQRKEHEQGMKHHEEEHLKKMELLELEKVVLLKKLNQQKNLF